MSILKNFKMKNIILILYIICTSALWCNAQSNTVVAGGEATGNGGSASFTAGEVFYTSKSGNGLSSTDGMQQGIWANPTAVISGTNSICNGSIASLSIAFTGVGPWTGTLSDGTPFTTSNNPYTINVSPSSTTTYTVASLTDQNGTAVAGDLTGSAIVDVNIVAANAGSDASTCGGPNYYYNLLLQNATASGGTVSWSSSGNGWFQYITGSPYTNLSPFYNIGSTDISNGSVTLTLTVTGANGCVATSSFTLTLVAPPSAVIDPSLVNSGSNLHVCAGGSYSFSNAQVMLGANIYWNTAGDGSFNNSGIQNPVYTPGPQDIINGSTTIFLKASDLLIDCSNSVSVDLIIDPAPAMPTLACYETATLNTTTCSWVVTGTQPSVPTLACYESANFNTGTCVWDVTGTQPTLPTLACYETATFNNSTCSWDVTGTIPTTPTLACYETASFNSSTCVWDVTGTQPTLPTLACYETAIFNTGTCSWDVTGTQPTLPTLACYETAIFNPTTCSWTVTGTQPTLPTLACYETATFNNSTCSWDVTGSQPMLPTLACYETASFNTLTCSWDVMGSQPALPTLACYETSTFNSSTCVWDVTGSPAAPIVTSASDCNSYIWSANGTAYTQSGTFTYYANCQDYTLNLTITPSTAYYKDADGDGYGVASSILYSCNGAPSGYAALPGDCDNDNSAIHPGATEICGNGIDDNCDGNIDEDCGCTNPPTANAGSNTNVCEGSTVSLNGSIGGSASNATWTTSGTGTFTPSANVLNATYVPSANDIAAGTVSLTLTSNAVAPCTAATSSLVITITPLPAATGAITGQANLCQPGLNPYFYSVTPVAGASSYVWTIPTGTVFDGDSTTSTVLVKYIDSYVQTGIAGNITVTPVTSTGCGSSSSSSLFVQAQIKAPVIPPSISGPQSVCNGDIATYSIANVARATSYIWTMPNGASIIGGAGTNIISVFYDATFIGGNITVASSNVCGTSAVRTRTISRNVLGAPGVITGPKDGLCGVSNVTYSIAAVTGVSSYSWTVPAGASIVGSSISNSITVNFSSLFTTGNITVASVNACGTGTARTLAVKAVPGQPASITGATTVCTLSSQTYSIQSVTGASSYVWTIPGGGTITSGQGSKIINMTYGPTPSANGIVTVKASNACGVSAVKVLAVVSNNCPRVGDATSLSMITYPNPANSILTVEFTAEQSQSVNMTMRDAAGRVVYNESKSTTIGVNSTTIDVSTFSKGVYLLQMQSDTNSEVIRILVE
jgi:hypothetical protein